MALDAAETDVQRAALIRMAFTAVDSIALRGELQLAEELFERVLAAAEATLEHEHAAIGELLTHATRIPMWREEWGLAAEGLEAALTRLEPDTLYRCIALNALAICEDHAGEAKAALERVDEAIRIGKRDPTGRAEPYGQALNTKAVILSKMERGDEARRVREELMAHLETHPRALDSLRYAQYEGHGILAHKAGLRDESRAHFERAIEIAGRIHGERSLEMARLRYLFGTLLAYWGEDGDALEVLTSATDMLEDARLLPEVNEVMLHAMSPWRALAFAHVIRARGTEAFDALEGHHGRLSLHGWQPAGREGGRGHLVGPRSMSAIQADLQPDEALVGWFFQDVPERLSKGRAFAFVLRATGEPHWAELARGDAASRRTLFTLRATVSLEDASPLTIVPGPETTVDDARAAYDLLFAPLAAHLEGVRHLILSAPQGLAGVPFACLRDGDGELLIDRYTLTFVPSGTLLSRLRGLEPVVPTDCVAVLAGDPPFRREHRVAMRDERPAGLAEATGMRRSLSSLEPSELPRLFGTRAEVEALEPLFARATTLVGEAANLGALRAAAIDADVIHFATHARFRPERAYRSALFFACAEDGAPSALTIAELLTDWQLKAELVTLSACSTGLGQELSSGAELGFPQAFLAAGARSVLATRWAVDDRATSLFMHAFYRAWLGSDGGPARSKAEALQAASQALRSYSDEDGRHVYAHPYYWAGFALTGDGR